MVCIFIYSPSQPKGQVRFSNQQISVVRRPSFLLKISKISLLWAKFNKSWHQLSYGYLVFKMKLMTPHKDQADRYDMKQNIVVKYIFFYHFEYFYKQRTSDGNKHVENVELYQLFIYFFIYFSILPCTCILKSIIDRQKLSQ